MRTYITRVTIRDGHESDYDKLDVAMEKRSFIKYIGKDSKDSAEVVREYGSRKLDSLQAVITAAYTAASSVGKQYRLTVMKEKKGFVNYV